MSKVHPCITPEIGDWLARQHIFFVATAPLLANGHVNCSPKGMDSFRVLDPLTVCYLDLTGSGVETIAHLEDNGRITFLFCAFDGPPNIVRLYGRGEVLLPAHPDFGTLRALFPDYPGVRSIVRVALDRVSDSCGYAVPRMDYIEDRSALVKWAGHRGTEGVAQYQRERNRTSIDNLTALDGREAS